MNAVERADGGTDGSPHLLGIQPLTVAVRSQPGCHHQWEWRAAEGRNGNYLVRPARCADGVQRPGQPAAQRGVDWLPARRQRRAVGAGQHADHDG